MKITYDSKSFLVDNKRIWIVDGEIHYFRFPRSEWRQVLLRAKRAGLNTISTYVPWNFHELKEGIVDFDGDKDLASFIDLIGEMGMYAMLRPGPYICSEWDGGGIPAWLCAKPVRRFREDDPVYMAAVESWFDKLIPIISERQITKGGPIITVQNENEYPGGWDESMRRYIEKIKDIFKKHGIEVPILACNAHRGSETEVQINFSLEEKDQLIDPTMILTYNHHLEFEPVYHLKSRQPDAPLLITEFWSGQPVYWGNHIDYWPHHLLQARAVYEYTSAATQVCYYMFEGGTNFGFWGGNNIATSYASSYPVGEGGKLTEKYYALRPANLFTSQFGEYLADSVERADKAGIQCSECVRLVVRECSKGMMAFITPKDKRKEIVLSLPDGKSIKVFLGDVAAAVIPVNLKLFENVTVDYSNLTLLARNEAKKAIILYGRAGTEGVVSLNGKEMIIPVCSGQVSYRETDGISIIVADEEMARRCWIVEDDVIFGPDFVAEEDNSNSLEIKVSDATPEIVYLDEHGCPVYKHYNYEIKEFKPSVLDSWKQIICDEIKSDQVNGWLPLDKPYSHENLGVVQGYVWYRAELECTEEGIHKLLLTNTPNRVSVFVNGKFSGTSGERRSVRMRDEYSHPADWMFEELTVRLKKGRNYFVFLSEDIGHNYDVPVPVGIQGPVFLESRIIDIEQIREITPLPVSKDALNFLYSRIYRELNPLPAVEFEISLKDDEQAFITIHGPHTWVTVNGKDVLPLSYPESPYTMFHGIKRLITWQLPEKASGRKNTVRVQYVGCVPDSVKENMTVYIVPKSGELSNWQWKLWEQAVDFTSSDTVKGNEEVKDSAVLLLPAGGNVARKGRLLTPSYFETHFTLPEGEQPVYLKVGEMNKGQIFLNGHNIGRFWRSGRTQELYYLPRSWMKETNQLVIFEELGLYPQDTSLVFGDSGQCTSARLERTMLSNSENR